MTFVFLSFGFVSDFGFRVSTLVCSWRPLRLCERSSFSDTLNPNSTENFRYVWLVFDSWGGAFWSIPRLLLWDIVCHEPRERLGLIQFCDGGTKGVILF